MTARELGLEKRERLKADLETLLLKTPAYPPQPPITDGEDEGGYYAAFDRFAWLVKSYTDAFGGGTRIRKHFAQYFLEHVFRQQPGQERDSQSRELMNICWHLVLGGDYDGDEFAQEAAVLAEKMKRSFTSVPTLSSTGEATWFEILRTRREFRSQYAFTKATGQAPSRHKLHPDRQLGRHLVSHAAKVVAGTLESRDRMRDLWWSYTRDFASDFMDSFIATTGDSWSPVRNINKYAISPSRPTLNSCRDHPHLGMTMNFLRVARLVGEGLAGPYSSRTVVDVGERFRCVAFISDETALETTGARDVKLRIETQQHVEASHRITAYLSASNINPPELKDTAQIILPKPEKNASLRIVSGSVRIYDWSAKTDTTPESGNDLFRSGLDISYAQQHSDTSRTIRQVMFDAVVDYPNFVLNAWVKKYPETEDLDQEGFGTALLAKPGEILSVVAQYINTGTMRQDDVRLSVNLPPALRLYDEYRSVRVLKYAGQEDYPAYELPVERRQYVSLGTTEPGERYDIYLRLQVRERVEYGGYRRGAHWLNMPEAFQVQTKNGTKNAGIDLIIHAEVGSEIPPGFAQIKLYE